MRPSLDLYSTASLTVGRVGSYLRCIVGNFGTVKFLFQLGNHEKKHLLLEAVQDIPALS